MVNGRYFTVKLPPGKHLVRLTSEKKGFAIDLGPGQTYYFRVGLEMGMWKGHGKITLEDAGTALPEIKKLKFLGKDKIKNQTLVVELTRRRRSNSRPRAALFDTAHPARFRLLYEAIVLLSMIDYGTPGNGRTRRLRRASKGHRQVLRSSTTRIRVFSPILTGSANTPTRN